MATGSKWQILFAVDKNEKKLPAIILLDQNKYFI
jgi:hypothetical protein